MSEDNNNHYESELDHLLGELEEELQDIDLEELEEDLEEGELGKELDEDLKNLDLDDLDDISPQSQEEKTEEDVSEDVFAKFFENDSIDVSEESLGLFGEEDVNKLEDMMDEVESNNTDIDSSLWHDYTEDSDLFKDPNKDLQDAVNFTNEDFNNITPQVLVIDGVSEKFEVEKLKALTLKQSNIDRGSTCFISTSGTLVEVGKLEICLDTFLYLFDMWNYDVYILTSTDKGMIQNKVNLGILGLLLV